MSRDTIDVRECDRCKVKVEARGTEDFDGWATATATGQRGGERTGFANADLCPDCMDFLTAWFMMIMRERDAERTFSERPQRIVPPVKEIVAQLISDNLAQSPEMDDYFRKLDEIDSLDDLQEYQAKNALMLMRWMADPETSPQLREKHQQAYERLSADQEPA